MAELRIGVIGAAGGQGRSWAKRIMSWPKLSNSTLKLAAVCDKEDIILTKGPEQFKCPAYLKYNEMFEKEKLDIVIIATPHFLHAPMTIAAAEHGINILSEKPTAINLKQVDDMKAAVDKAKVKCAIGFQHRFNPLFVGLKNAITSGDLGDIYQINMVFHWYRKEEYYLNSSPVPENADEDWEGWRGHWKTEGAGALANQMVHFMDIFQWLSPSPIQAVTAVSRVAKHTLIETDDNTNAIVEFANGSMGSIQAGVAYDHAKEEEFGVFGTNGALIRRERLRGALGLPKIYDDLRAPEIKKKKSILKYIPRKFNLNQELFKNLVESIEMDDPKHISVDVAEGRKVIELMRGILLSQNREQKIKFPYEDKPNEFPKLWHTYKDPKFADLV